jgi:hypothetical protein
MAGTTQLDSAFDRTSAAETAGNTYTIAMEDIRNNIDTGANNDTGTSLGLMVKSQLEITEAETMYQVTQGLPNTVSKAVKTAAAAVKQAGG